MGDASITSDSTADTAPGKMGIFRLILVYPTLFVAILGALPTLSTLIASWKLPVPVPLNQVDNVKEQYDLLKSNFSCTQEATNHPLSTHDNVTIGAVVCASGDVAIVAQNTQAGSYPNPVIVPWKTIVSQGEAAQASLLLRSLLPVSSAYAQPLPPQPAPSPTTVPTSAPTATVICQRLQDKGNLLRRIRQPDGSCVDVTSNVYNRKTETPKPAPCEPTC